MNPIITNISKSARNELEPSASCIAFGGSGFNIMNDFEKLGIAGQKIVYSKKNESTAPITVTTNFSELIDRVNISKELYVTGGLGGAFSEIAVVQLLEYMSQNKVSFKAVFTLPFEFEGPKRTRAGDLVAQSIKQYSNVTLLNHQDNRDWSGEMEISHYFLEMSKRIYINLMGDS